MATTFQVGTLFDHFCTKLHIGAGLDRTRAFQLRGIIHASVSDAERTALVAVFRDGGKILGRSMLEAPAWMSSRFERAAEQWMRSGGNPGALDEADTEGATDAENARWLDRASAAVEGRLNGLGSSYMRALVGNFERRWRQSEEELQKEQRQKEEKRKEQAPASSAEAARPAPGEPKK
jgi:hypothetical protein